MTPSDELWIEMAQFDNHTADGVWEGTVPDDAPPWCHEVTGLIRAARGPGQPDELAGEGAIVARMRAAVLEARAGSGDAAVRAGAREAEAADGQAGRAGAGDDERVPAVLPAPPALTVVGSAPADAGHDELPPVAAELAPAGPGAKWTVRGESDDDSRAAGRGGRIAGRIVAMKTVAATTALAVGITAAAATTGLVTVVVPAARERFDPKTAGEVVEDEDDSPARSQAPGGRGSGRTSEACPGDARCGDGGATAGTRGRAAPGDTTAGDAEDDADRPPGTTTADDAATGADGEPSTTTTESSSSSTTGTSGPSASTSSSTTAPPDTTTSTTGSTVEPRSDPGDEDAAGSSSEPSAAASGANVVQVSATSGPSPASEPRAAAE